MGQILHFNPAYLYITITYITRLLIQFSRLNETCRMIGYLLLFFLRKRFISTKQIYKKIIHTIPYKHTIYKRKEIKAKRD